MNERRETDRQPARGAGVRKLPARLPRQPVRPAQPTIPNDKVVRDALARLARKRAARLRLVPPVGVQELREHGEHLCRQLRVDRIFADFAAILVNNEAWRDTVAGIPFERRLLLLPKCLRADGRCTAPIDEFGLVCQGCGLCAIHQLEAEARRLGYTTLVAEGSPVVIQMIETGQIKAIVGVSCTSVLEKCFVHMESRAVPGIAIPLLQDGCASTSVDLDWILDAIHLTSEDRAYRLDLEALKTQVEGWFERGELDRLLGESRDQTETISRDWLARAGKRWRPYLATCTCLSLRDELLEKPEVPDDLKRLAIAVECFHKASLIHDDIEDEDEQRYGQSALHIEHGVPVAINVGDFLIGLGYQLIERLDVEDSVKASLLGVAAMGHLTLCRGQGAELCWTRQPTPLAALEVLEIFRQKTAPAFEVALRLGASYGNASGEVHESLARYSEALGIAYQIRDDLEDFLGLGDSDDVRDMRPSLILAIAHKRAEEGAERELTHSLWNRTGNLHEVVDGVRALAHKHGAVETADNLRAAYADQAAKCLQALENPTLKGLLRRVIGRIFGDDPIRGYCSELEARRAAERAAGPEPAA